MMGVNETADNVREISQHSKFCLLLFEMIFFHCVHWCPPPMPLCETKCKLNAATFFGRVYFVYHVVIDHLGKGST